MFPKDINETFSVDDKFKPELFGTGLFDNFNFNFNEKQNNYKI